MSRGIHEPSLIGIIKSKKPYIKARCIYCARGYGPEEVGTILTYHYRSLSKVEKLLALGNIYRLYERVAPPPSKASEHTVEHPIPHVTIAYYRDNMRKRDIAKMSSVLITFDEQCEEIWDSNVMWAYLFDPNNLTWSTYLICREEENGEEYIKLYQKYYDYEYYYKENWKYERILPPKK